MSSSGHHDDGRGEVLAATFTVLGVSLVSIALRFWSRATSKTSRLWWDDWLALASVPFIIVVCTLAAWWVSLGLGLHTNQASGTRKQWLLIIWIENLVYNTGLSFVKLSVVLFYFRVFQRIRAYKTALYFTGFLVVAWCIGNNLLAILECLPVRSYWEHTPGHCINNESGFLGTTISNVTVDIIILVLPLPMLWRLQIKRTRKLALVGVFLCGYCVVIVSVVRLVTIVQLGQGVTKDITWSFVNPQILVTIETPIALFSSCLPSIFQLVKRLNKKRLFGTGNSSRQLVDTEDVRMGPLGNPIDDRTNKGFLRLQDWNGKMASKEKLYARQEENRTTHVADAGKVQGATKGDHDLSSQQIHVRQDVDVEASLTHRIDDI